MNLDIIKNEFDNYCSLFDKNNYDVNYKYQHSYRVQEIANYIAKNLNLSEEDIVLANVIGLLHDIGRFKQLEMFGTYDDKNIDHVDLGVKILFEDNLIENFKIDKKYYKIIKLAIKNHNKLNLEDNLNEKELLHAKIIRDADKIDILKAYTIFKNYKLEETDDLINEEVKKSFYGNESVKHKDVKNKNEKILLVLTFVYDINYDISLKIIKEEKLIECLYETIKNKNIFEPYFRYMFNYLEKRDV